MSHFVTRTVGAVFIYGNASVYTHNQTEYYILTDDGVTKAGWQDGMLSYVISGQISEAEIKEMINSIQ